MNNILLPQLAQTLDRSKIAYYVYKENWTFEQKLDGQRLVMHASDGVAQPMNRTGGKIVNVSKLILADFIPFSKDWIFDGELMDDGYWIFDVLMVNGAEAWKHGFADRREILEATFQKWDPDYSFLLPDASTVPEKMALIHEVQNRNGEGLILKQADASYSSGRRVNSTLKVKFTYDVDAVVVDMNRYGKQNITVAVHRNDYMHTSVCNIDCDGLVEIGEVTALAGDGLKASLGDVVTVKYLYATPDSRIYQPTLPRLRFDKKPDECDLSQLVYADKQVIV